MKRIERIRLYPTRRQTAALERILDVTRDLYNAALQERRDAYKLRGVSISGRVQYAELTALRSEDMRVASVYRECEDAVLHRLDLAFAAFFRRLNSGHKPGFPRFKTASSWRQFEFPHGSRALKFDDKQSQIRVPGVGAIRLRKGRRVPVFGRAWLVRRNERWYASFEYERREVQGPVDFYDVVGVDRGVHVLAAISTGHLIRGANALKKLQPVIAKLQRDLETVSEKDALGRVRNYRAPERIAAARRLGRAKEHEANKRRDHAHKVARRIVGCGQVIAIEDLRVQSMTRSAKGTISEPGRNVRSKRTLNRRLRDAAFGLLGRMIAAKAEEAGKLVIRVDAKFTSRECARCGTVAARSRRRRRYRCVACGFVCHADVNAASVIRRRAQSALLRTPEAGEEPAGRIGVPGRPRRTKVASLAGR